MRPPARKLRISGNLSQKLSGARSCAEIMLDCAHKPQPTLHQYYRVVKDVRAQYAPGNCAILPPSPSKSCSTMQGGDGLLSASIMPDNSLASPSAVTGPMRCTWGAHKHNIDEPSSYSCGFIGAQDSDEEDDAASCPMRPPAKKEEAGNRVVKAVNASMGKSTMPPPTAQPHISKQATMPPTLLVPDSEGNLHMYVPAPTQPTRPLPQQPNTRAHQSHGGAVQTVLTLPRQSRPPFAHRNSRPSGFLMPHTPTMAPAARILSSGAGVSGAALSGHGMPVSGRAIADVLDALQEPGPKRHKPMAAEVKMC